MTILKAVSVAAMGALSLFHSSFGQAYPERPVRLVVPFAPGGPTDMLARALDGALAEKWGQQIVVDNRPGAAGNIGSKLAAASQADGYTLLMGTVATHGINPGLYKNMPYDAVRDFDPITCIASVPNILVVHPSVPVKTVQELIRLAKAKPDKLNYASSGNGTASHLAAELFKSMAKVELVHIPYKSAAPAITALIANQVQLSFASVVPVLPHLNENRLRALAVTSSARLASLPNVPTIAEAGVPNYESVGWTGLLAPAGVPSVIIRKINQDVVQILKSKEMRRRLENGGASVVANSPEQFKAFIKAELAKWARVVEVSGAAVD